MAKPGKLDATTIAARDRTAACLGSYTWKKGGLVCRRVRRRADERFSGSWQHPRSGGRHKLAQYTRRLQGFETIMVLTSWVVASRPMAPAAAGLQLARAAKAAAAEYLMAAIGGATSRGASPNANHARIWSV